MDFAFIKEFFDILDFNIDVRYQDYNKEKGEGIYLLNNEPVYIETKNEVRPQNINMFEKQRSENLPVLVASKYITPKSKELLKEKGINYIDSFGNAYIALNNLKVYVEQGNAKPVYEINSNRAFTKSGAQVIFQLLKDSEAANFNHRDLARKSKVSLGTVSNVINGLFDLGFLVKWKNGNSYQLVNKEALLEKWIILLNEKTIPAFFLGHFRMSETNKNNYRSIPIDQQTYWSGEVAAAELTGYLTPEKLSLYTTKSKMDIIKDYRLLPDNKGSISIYKPFWNIEDSDSYLGLNGGWGNKLTLAKPTVHPLIVYAELIYSGNTRNIETAQILFNEHVKPNL